MALPLQRLDGLELINQEINDLKVVEGHRVSYPPQEVRCLPELSNLNANNRENEMSGFDWDEYMLRKERNERTRNKMVQDQKNALYPHAAGFKEKGATSEAAAKMMDRTGKRESIKDAILNRMSKGWNGTVYDMALVLDKPYHSVQPRFSELLEDRKIKKTKSVLGPYGVRIWSWEKA